ncbi:hypothetical protein HA402_005436 [Bradysia odoriphaga]|nr:hypothetical protein HA402_005436 [Bradysia odoriphaga]
MEALKSVCNTIWLYIESFAKSVWEWTVDAVKKAFKWISTSIYDLFAKIKNLRGSPALDSDDMRFLDAYEAKLQDANNDLLRFQKVCEKAVVGTDAEKLKAKSTLDALATMIRSAESG